MHTVKYHQLSGMLKDGAASLQLAPIHATAVHATAGVSNAPEAAGSSTSGSNRAFKPDLYLLMRNPKSFQDIWREFRYGEAGKKPVVELMGKYGEESWFAQPDTSEGQNNRKNLWNRRNKPIVLEILYRMMVLKHPERRALADLQEHETAAGTVAKFSKWLKANGKCQGKDKQKEAKDQLTQLVNILRPADAVVRS
ncbi:hypothetical protein WJX72_008143 [[Myrmecia] bisecta]|uniref:Transcription activator GCR1-like domain-containing protein n=1 Tax=[Myrmecia] bisecta TaxID=41462 RepID=A0AAW1Q3H1_9CHLO